MAELIATGGATGLQQSASAGPLAQLRGLAQGSAMRRVMPWFLGASALGAVALTWAVLAPAPQRTLYAELGDAERAAVVSSLETAGIAYAIDNQTGTLTVGEDDLYRARALVAQDGALALPDAASSLDSLPLGASRTLEGERLRSARERELTLTIQEIDGVESVRIHLAEAARSVFVRDNAPPSASVMVRMARGRQLGDSQVSAIVNLVAGSVPGMSPDAVRVADQNGRLLSAKGGGESDRLELQGRMEDKLRAQLDQLLTPMLGANMFTSEIQIELDLDQVTSARESYDKDGVVRSESQAQSQSGAAALAGGVPGVLSNTPPPASTVRAGAPQPTTVPGAPSQTSPGGGESSATRTYELGREVSVANAAPGKVKRLSVAVAISQAAMKKAKPGDIDQIKALVSAAVGADPQRGDQVQVLVRPFEPISEEAAPFYEASWFALVVRSVVALIGVLLVLLLAVKPLIGVLRRRGENAPQPDIVGGFIQAGGAAAAARSDPALLGRQVSLAQRIVEEKPEDALVALRQMLGQPNSEAAS